MNWNETRSLGLLVLGCMLDSGSWERNGKDGDDLPEASRQRWRRRMATVAVSGDVGEWQSSVGLFPPGFRLGSGPNQRRKQMGVVFGGDLQLRGGGIRWWSIYS